MWQNLGSFAFERRWRSQQVAARMMSKVAGEFLQGHSCLWRYLVVVRVGSG